MAIVMFPKLLRNSSDVTIQVVDMVSLSDADVPLRNYSLTTLLVESSPCNEHGTFTRSE